ncbi:hypothetical protein OH77DRAFT_17530 [Trametes cingulata]|nr:hypothetical protein OH77DRAFT_17530 [Trametes cingulata]
MMRRPGIRTTFYERPSAMPDSLYCSKSYKPASTLQALMGLQDDEEAFCRYAVRIKCYVA